MKKIPESYELTEEDIKEAITYWLNQEHGDGEGYEHDFEINFERQTKREFPKGGPVGGQSDPVLTDVLSAKAVKVE